MGTLERIGRGLYQARMAASSRAGRLLPRQTVAEAVGITPQTLANWEHGQTRVDLAVAQKLADYYGISIDELAGRA